MDYGQGQKATNPIGTLQAAPPPVSPAMQHANDLHDTAGRFGDLNARLTQAINRLAGSIPESASASTAKDTPQDGVLHIAAFGAQRLRLESDRYAELLQRLESIV